MINARSDVAVDTISNPYYLVLSGDDLQIINKLQGEESRVVTLKGTYNSVYGNNLPFTYTVSFTILNQLVIATDLFASVTDMVFSEDFIYV